MPKERQVDKRRDVGGWEGWVCVRSCIWESHLTCSPAVFCQNKNLWRQDVSWMCVDNGYHVFKKQYRWRERALHTSRLKWYNSPLSLLYLVPLSDLFVWVFLLMCVMCMPRLCVCVCVCVCDYGRGCGAPRTEAASQNYILRSKKMKKARARGAKKRVRPESQVTHTSEEKENIFSF